MKRIALANVVWVLGSLPGGIGCSREHAVIASPAEIEHSEIVPRGYVALGAARARCAARPAWGTLHGEPLRNFACTTARVRQSLAEQASAAGGTLLARERCREDAAGGRSCSATIARPEGPNAKGAPKSATAEGWDDSDAPRAELLERIRIDLTPRAEHFVRRARLAGSVAEPALLPVSHVELGALRARCAVSACADADLRIGLRLAAGGLGATDLVGVACSAFDGERTCMGTLAASERDPERDANAR